MRGWLPLRAFVILLGLAAPAWGSDDVISTVRPDGAPQGVEFRELRDCRIVSSGQAPDAKLRCSPPLGWKLFGADGKLLYPAEGHLPDPRQSLFRPAFGLIEHDGAVARVSFAGQPIRHLPFGRLAAIDQRSGASAAALLWSGETTAALVMNDGTITSVDNAPAAIAAAGQGDSWCRSALLLAALRAEGLPNRRWAQLRRIVFRPAGLPANCTVIAEDIVAGEQTDGWRWLDPATFEPRDTRVFASPKAIVAAVRRAPRHPGP